MGGSRAAACASRCALGRVSNTVSAVGARECVPTSFSGCFQVICSVCVYVCVVKEVGWGSVGGGCKNAWPRTFVSATMHHIQHMLPGSSAFRGRRTAGLRLT